MKTRLFIIGASMLALASCSKNLDVSTGSIHDASVTTDNTSSSKDYVQYTIKKGEQYCDKSTYQGVSYSQLVFKVKFDSSAVYQTADPLNQKDLNKLYGFSDNNAAHHQYSARFGWRWLNNALHLFGYTYNNSVLTVQEVSTVNVGEENSCSIKVDGGKYIYTVNGTSISMDRASTTTIAEGYQLFPYFGGDEMAPHEIKIWIK